MASFSSLIVPQTAAQIEADILAVLQEADFPVTSWDASGVPKRLIKAFAKVMAAAWIIVSKIALGAFVETATGAWLTFRARNSYAMDRAAAVSTEGIFRFTNTSGAPVPIAALQYLVRDATGKLFWRNTDDGDTGGSIADGDFADVAVKAEAPGSKYNVPNGATLLLSVDVPGLAVTNPAVGVTGTWITTAGADEQSDTSLRAAVPAKWATLGTGSPEAAYRAWAIEAAPTITRVAVDAENPLGPGTLRLICANSAGGATFDELTAVTSFISGKSPVGAGVSIAAAVNLNVNVTGTVRVQAAYLASAQTQVAANFSALAAATEIGGDDDEATIYGAEITAQIMSVDGVINFSPAPGDVAIDVDEVPVFDLSGLVWEAV